jgi:methylmalonyl-CoA mutase N-terminal domain/subunit
MSESKSKNSMPFLNRSGIEIPLVAEDPKTGHLLGKPGEYPFLRGIQKDMYRGRHWTMRQYAGFGTAEESNRRYHYLLSQGTTGLSVAFDLPTQLGFDPDHARARGEVGKVGVSISSLEDMRVLFRGIDLSKVSTSMTINATAPILLAFYCVVAEEQGADLAELRGTIQNDVLKEYIARGNYIYPPSGALRLTSDVFEWCSRKLPKWNPISISGYHIREAGSTAVQELAFTFSNARTYVESAIARGMEVDTFAPQLSFFFNVHNDFFEEIAKFRAARRIWARMMKERFQARNPKSWMLRFHSQTAGSTLTAQQPENNVVRVTLQALAAVLGGTQSLHTNSMDEALGLPTEKTAELALRTQQILAYESQVTQTVDPLGGSFFIEKLTNEVETRALKLMEDIEARGGVVSSIESGWIQNEILNSAYADQRAVDSGDLKVVGVNCFQTPESHEKREILRVDPELEKQSVLRLKKLRDSRESAIVLAALARLEDGARSDQNLMDLIFEAARAQATLGEIADTLRKVFGEYRQIG